MTNTEPKLLPQNFIGSVEIQMNEIVRNMFKFINIDIKHPGKKDEKRGILKI